MGPIHTTSPLAALSAFALALAVAGSAHADKLKFTGTHAIRFAHNGQIQEVSAAGTGVAIANAHSGPLQTLQLTRDFAKINGTVTATMLGTGIDKIKFAGVRINPKLAGPDGHPGVFAPILAAAQGGALAKSTLPAAGTVRLCNLVSCPASVAVKLTQTVGPGVGGTIVATGMSGTMPGLTMLTVVGHPWKVGTTTVTYRTAMGTMNGTFMDKGFAKGPLGNTGTTLDTIMGTTTMGAMTIMGGQLQLVTGIQTTCAGCGGNNDPSGQIARLTLNFAPEPGLLVMLGAGAAGLVLLGRTRARR